MNEKEAVRVAIASTVQNIPLNVKPELVQRLNSQSAFAHMSDGELRERVRTIPGMISRRQKRQPIFDLENCNRAFLVALLLGSNPVDGVAVL